MDVYLLVQNSDMIHSPAQDAVVRVYSRISEASMDRTSPTPARLLVPSQHIGCLLGKGGSIITEMRKITGASIRIFGNEQIPRCAQRNDEMVQVYHSCNKPPYFLFWIFRNNAVLYACYGTVVHKSAWPFEGFTNMPGSYLLHRIGGCFFNLVVWYKCKVG